MSSVFQQLIRLSLTAGWMTLLLLLLRPLLKKAPRKFSCLLWGLVAVRLMLPFSLESRVSLVPQSIAAPAQMLEPIRLPTVAAPAMTAQVPSGSTAAAAGIPWQAILPIVWACGAAAMIAYALVSYLRLRRKVKVSVRVRRNVYLCDNVTTPFVLGIVRPKIYLPSSLDNALTFSVLAHERAHLRRGDHIWKLLGYLLLSVYWFNPVCWLAYVLFCRDMEQACDEAAVQNMDVGAKKAYSTALLACSIRSRSITACPLAFAEVGVKQRIRGVLRYRKPRLPVMLMAALLCLVLAVCLLTDPVRAEENVSAESESSSFTLPEGTTLYATPDFVSGAFSTLSKNRTVQVLKVESVGAADWAFIQFDFNASIRGWVPFSALETISGDAAQTSGSRYVLPENAVVRTSPSTYSPDMTTLKAGTEVSALRRVTIAGAEWIYVRYSEDGNRGWIADAGVESMPSEQEPVFPLLTLDSAATLYRLPEVDSPVSATLEAGVTVEARCYEDGAAAKSYNPRLWVYVRCNAPEAEGWMLLRRDQCAMAYLQGFLTACAETAPDAAEAYLQEGARAGFRESYRSISDWTLESFVSLGRDDWGAGISTQDGCRYYLIEAADGRFFIAPTGITDIAALPNSWQQALAAQR